MAKTLYQKLVDTHTVARLDAQNVLLYADLHIMNEYTSPQAFAGLREAGRAVAVPGQHMAVVDHIIPTHPVRVRVIQDPASALQASNLAKNCRGFPGRRWRQTYLPRPVRRMGRYPTSC